MKKNKISIGQQLRNFAANIVVDPFGYENIIHQNARNFATTYSKQLSVSPDNIHLRITHHNSLLTAFLYNGNMMVKQIELADLVAFFTGVTANARLEAKVTRGIFQFIDDFMKTNEGLNRNKTAFHIQTTTEQTFLNVYHDQELIEQVGVKKLIRYFK